MEDLYKVLGVKADATADEIRKAYLKKSKKLHPDAGGTTEGFQRLNRAYQILYDDKLRQQYDETGEEPIESKDMSVEIISQLFARIMSNPTLDVTQNNVIELLRRTLKSDRHDFETGLANLDAMVMRLHEIDTRISGGELFGSMIAAYTQQVRQQISVTRNNIATADRALAILEPYEYRLDGMAEMQNYIRISFASTSTA